MKKRFRALELIAKRYLETYNSGIHPTLIKDSLIEVDVVREYQPGDKRLDSKSSLKTGKTMSRVFNPERSLNLFIILDISSSQYKTLNNVVVTALYLCYLGDMCNERIGLCLFFDNIVSIVDMTGDYSSVVGAIEKSLNELKIGKKTCVENAIKKVSELTLTNSMIVFISDFYYPLTSCLLNNVKKMALVPTNMFLNIVIYDPIDWFISINDSLNVNFADAETGEIGNYNIKSAKINFEKWLMELKQKLFRCNTDVVLLDVKQEQFLLPLIKHLIKN